MKSLLFCLVFVQFTLQSYTQNYCDQRPNGGILLCCKGYNSLCYSKTGSCYCDEYCLTAKDCCPDFNQCPYRGNFTTVATYTHSTTEKLTTTPAEISSTVAQPTLSLTENVTTITPSEISSTVAQPILSPTGNVTTTPSGTKLPQQCTYHPGTNIPLCPDAIPVVDKIVANPNNDGKENVQLNCSWVYNGNSSLVEFKVRWIGDKNDPERRIERDFDGMSKREFFYDFELSDGMGGFIEHGKQPSPQWYKFNTEVYCEIQARYKGTAAKWSGWKQSNTIFTGISVFPQHVTLNECGNDRHITITLRPHLPINERPFNFEIHPENNEYVNEICVRGEISNEVQNPRCETQLKTSNSFYKPLHIKLLASCKQFVQNANQPDVATFKFHQPIYSATNNKFWISYQFPTITVTVNRAKDKQTCYSVTDPHFLTFDKRRYDFMGIGTFILYRNKASDTQVQTRQKSCGGGFASCNCAVAIKEGFFFQIFDMCQAGEPSKGKTPWWQNPQNLITKSRQMANSLKDGFSTTKTAVGNQMHYKTTLPSGVVVTVERRYWGLSTYVKAPRPVNDEQHNIDGLCGNFNGNPNDDFGGKSVNEFGNSNRIDDKDSIFQYAGDIEGEDGIHNECLDEDICICGREKSFCGDKAAKKCFPDVFTDDNGNGLSQSTEGLCGKEPPNNTRRRKRALFSPDDTVDDQDDIPSFNPPNITITSPTWPTPNGLTEAEVTNICNEKIRNSKGGQSCGTVTGVNLDSVVESCISDIKATDDISWATDNFAAMETSCKKNILTNSSYYKNNTDGEFEVATDIFEYLCPSDCSNHGNCSNATCICDKDYTAPDCSVSLKDRPFVFDIRKAGLCDVRKRPCRNVGIYAFPLVASENLTCHLKEYKVIDSAWTPSNATMISPGLQVDFAEVKCSLPESPVNLGDYDNVGVTAAGLRIGISNNRINISENSMLFITYDSVCQDCNTSTGCEFKNNSCLIFGHCFAQNESHPTDWCQQCLPNISTTSWQERRDNLRPNFTNPAVFSCISREQLRVQLNAVDPENRKSITNLRRMKYLAHSYRKWLIYLDEKHN
ncbi:von Willebrand factor D and EGF domain-containing protein-like [Dendronephthya gigantea]|uniref:von Willebrand factor D and EGF domain-containing protein-like n=1 Tax=Dendronephthya gigantea TaxID=151771 RepID=UPI001069D8FF|nr:von Willebrand factor D and EGF domain-containing protein-like [Dendronephthya gigantea]